MRLAVDTNRYTDLAHGDPGVAQILETALEVHLPFVVLAELRAGFLLGSRSDGNERILLHFLRKPRVSVLYPTESTTRIYASLFRQLRHQGTPIPTNDLWIAALAVENDLTLFSRDAHFRHLPQIRVVESRP